MGIVLKSFIKNPEKTSYDGKDNDEQVLYVIRKSLLILVPHITSLLVAVALPFFLLPYIIKFNTSNGFVLSSDFIVTMAIFWYLICFGYLLMVFINWYFNVFIITTKKIVDIDVHGFLYKNVSEAAIKNIEDVTSTVRGTLGTMFNIGEVYLQTAGEKREFEFSSVDNPSFIRDIISDLVSSLKTNEPNN